uniref:Transmembrane protein n=1 Tax=viral metagenome TaxID=1070528 RepID=A0A6C0F8E5_9ZZZZ
MAFPKRLNQLCTPSLVYFVISMIALAISVVQNMGNRNKYSLGNFSCRVPSTIAVFIVKVIYILFWTWILNLICKDGYTSISWILVLLPFILLFVIMGLIMINQ